MSNEKILWEEGMFLGPQHFQAFERHLLYQMQGSRAALQPHGHGLVAIRIDENLLQQGEFVLEQCAAVFRDGLFYRAPTDDQLPPRRKFVDAFHPRSNVLGVFLAVREPRAGSMLSRAEDASAIGRYRRRKLEMVDDYAGSASRDIAVGDLDVRTVWQGESLDGCQSLEIARIMRSGNSYQLDKEFVPSCLHVGASQVLQRLLRRTGELLTNKSEELARKRGQRVGGTAQFTSAEAATYWLRHTVNSFMPLVAHHGRTPSAHPEVVYGTLASLVGALCTYSPDKQPTIVPPYDHGNLTATFAELEKHLRDLPQQIAPETCIHIPLKRKPPDEWVGTIEDDALLERADFYVALSGASTPEKFIREAPFKVKITSPAQMEAIRTFNVRGVVLTHVPVPPSDIPQRQGCQYFVLTRDGKHWDAIRDVRTLCISVPTEFDEAQVECMCVKKVSP